MTVLPPNPIPSLIARYRKLKAQRDVVDGKMAVIKAELKPAVEANSDKWTDDQGYARMITRKDSVSYPSADVDRLAETWAKSNTPAVQDCGNMLLVLRKQKAGYTYLQVK